MSPITERQGRILALTRGRPSGVSAARIQGAIGVSIATVKRDIRALSERGLIESSGRGRVAGYRATKHGELVAPIDAHTYCAQEPDARGGFERYDAETIASLPGALFSSEELAKLNAATEQYRIRADASSDTIAKKELERFVIELSWKSSRIEGNTYTLLDTERLIREGVEAVGHNHEEAVMILNHKSAFAFVVAHRAEFVGAPSSAVIDELHRLLTDGLHVARGVRQQVVGIVGTRYRPLENPYQIHEAMDTLRAAIARAADPYTAALIALLGISYIQPFEDGNKRTARMLSNALLLAHAHAPLSYRSVDEVVYRETMLVFYETHSLVSFKALFMAQYLFAAEQYGVR